MRVAATPPRSFAAALQPASRSLWEEATRRLLRKPTAVLSMLYIMVLMIIAMFAKQIAPFPYDAQEFHQFLPPGTAGHLLGTDDLGRDILSRMIYGARVSMSVSVVVLVVALVIGLVVGALAGYYGGLVDMVIMRLTDVMFAFPELLFAILIMGIRGHGSDGGFTNLITALGVVAWPGLARMVRGQVLSLKHLEYVQAARSLGNNDARIILRHLFPNLLSPVLVSATQSLAGFVLAEASLSFLGIGIQAPQPSWGSILSNSSTWIYSYPTLLLGPCLVLAFTVLAFNFLGDGLRDALDPRLTR